jgi:hypothetical protein
MSASVVQFPNSEVPLNKRDAQILALIRQSLAAWRALDRDCSRLDMDDSPEAKAELRRLDAAVSDAEDRLAALAERDRTIRGWLADCVGRAVENSRFRRERN